MGAFRYCPDCDLGVDQPTAREDLLDGQRCGRGHLQRQWQTEKEWIVDLDERLKALEPKETE